MQIYLLSTTYFCKKQAMTAILANERQWEELNVNKLTGDFIRLFSFDNIAGSIDAYLVLDDNIKVDFKNIQQPVLINSVTGTLKEMNAPANIVRINGWNSFIGRSTWEVAGAITETVQQVLTALGKKIIPVPDEPGLISARIIAMIINEAFFAFEDKLSSKQEIDIAMKLGTNFPYGPFEWASLIGPEKIYALLLRLSLSDSRYCPAALLKNAATL